ncbi:MAG TPA: T9SS type A sorting domain-containing protein [Bacteroidia bacterium]|nr:T9SS type A sorting domain-containing protein [Bacteroidia bacterium]
MISKFTISTLLVGCSLSVLAQNPITTNIIPPVGAVIVYDYLDTTGVQPGSAGNGQTWNFSSFSPLNEDEIQTVVPVASAPSISSFPGTNYVIKGNTMVSNDTAFAYYNSTSSILEIKGTYLASQTLPFAFPYSNPETSMIFPFNFNGTFSDNFVGSYTVMNSGITITDYRTGQVSALYDGYGTLQLPNGTYNNVARVKIHQHIVDSTVYVGIPLPAAVITYNGTTHDWFATNGSVKFNLLTFTRDTSVSNGSTTIDKTILYQKSYAVGIAEAPSLKAEVRAYPNPSNGMAFLEIENADNGTASIVVTDVTGKTVMSSATGLVANGFNKIAIDLEGLPTGLYQIRVVQDQNIWVSKILKD